MAKEYNRNYNILSIIFMIAMSLIVPMSIIGQTETIQIHVPYFINTS